MANINIFMLAIVSAFPCLETLQTMVLIILSSSWLWIRQYKEECKLRARDLFSACIFVLSFSLQPPSPQFLGDHFYSNLFLEANFLIILFIVYNVSVGFLCLAHSQLPLAHFSIIGLSSWLKQFLSSPLS